MVKKRRSGPPSRRKYEEANPVLSCRVPKKIYEELRVTMESAGEKRSKALLAGLGLFKVKVKTEREIWQKAYDKGYDDGVNAACNCFQVTYPCSKCGKEMVVESKEEKEAIRRFMIDAGWHHGDCSRP